jgi:hypothetical protein
MICDDMEKEEALKTLAKYLGKDSIDKMEVDMTNKDGDWDTSPFFNV